MRLIHTADWHLGAELHGFDRSAEHETFLDWLVETLVGARADALIVAGDVYHSVNPTVRAQKLLFRTLFRLRERLPDLQVVLVGGNHDSPARLELPAELLDGDRLRVVGAMPEPEDCLIPLRDAAGRVACVCGAVPYLRPGDLPASAPDSEDPAEHPVAGLYRRVADAAHAAHPEAPLLLTGHLHVAGGAVSQMSERRVMIGGSEATPTGVFPARAIYVALGHLHKPQSFGGRPMLRYAGSPFPMSTTERDYRHSITQIDLENGALRWEEIAIPRPVAFLRVPESGAAPLEQVEAALKALRVAETAPERQAFIEVAVKLDAPEPDLRRRVEEALGDAPVRLTRILRETAASGDAGAAADTDRDLDALSPLDMLQRRHRDAYGAEAGDDLVAAFLALEAAARADDDARDDPAEAA